MTKLPLEGIRVIDLTVVWAGPFATQILADWGAEVIRVESRQHLSVGTREEPTGGPGSGLLGAKPNRERGERPWNRVPSFNVHARNKLSMTVDLTQPEGLDIFKRLVKVSDITIENNGAGVVDKLGIGYEVQRSVKPDIIVISMPGFGSTGPYRLFRTFGVQLENFVGQAYLMGYRDCDPTTLSGTVHTDAVGGAMAAFAALLSLHYRNRTGKGRFVDLAQVEAVIPQFGESIMDWTMNHHIQSNLGNRHPSAIQGSYRCKGEDAWVNITICNDEEWEGFCRAIGSPAWTKEEKFSDMLSRYKNHDDLDRLIEDWTKQHDKYEVMHILQEAGVAAGPVMTERDCFSDPHIKERAFFQQLTQADCGTHLYPGTLWTMSEISNRIRSAPCLLGEHNEYVYKNILGVSDEEYSELEKAGHIGMEYIPGVYPD